MKKQLISIYFSVVVLKSLVPRHLHGYMNATNYIQSSGSLLAVLWKCGQWTHTFTY